MLTGLLFFATGCRETNGKRSIEAFYFPLGDLQDGLVYEYRSVGNPADPPMYWYYKSVSEGEKTYLIGMGYDPDFSPDQFIRELRVDNGMKLVDFYTYEKDPDGNSQKVQATIEAGNVFPFTVTAQPGVLLTSLQWESPSDSARINLVRNRQYDGDTTIQFAGKSYDAIRFHTIELVEHDEEGRLPLEFSGEEIYARGLGLVYLKKDISREWQMRYQLEEVYEMEKFEEKFRIRLKE